jgi:hypothetical protein
MGRAILDMQQTGTLYGDHAFLLYLWTDGWENESHLVGQGELRRQINNLPENWTIAGMGPNAQSLLEMKAIGIPAGNVAIWDTTTTSGLEVAAGRISTATDNFMRARAQGVRGTRDLFGTGPDAVNAQTIQAAGLGKLARTSYAVLEVRPSSTLDIREFVQNNGYTYYVGNAYYQLSKRETITPSKLVAVRDRRTGDVYSGPEARALIGLKGDTVRVTPDMNPAYDIFIQSRSVSRKLVPGTRVLYMKH